MLSSYDPNLIREVTDPRTGIAATEKYMSFMPNAGELKVYCDGVIGRRQYLRELGSLPRLNFQPYLAPPRLPGRAATVFVPSSNPRYAGLVEWAKTADDRLWKYDDRPGIWVSFDTWDNRFTEARSLANLTKSLLPTPAQQEAAAE